MSRLRVPADQAPQPVAAFRNRARPVERHDGFIDIQVWQSDRNRGQLIMISRWRDRDCFKAYTKSQDHRESHDRIDGDLHDAITLESLEHLHTYDVVAE